jgi:hypothetical protein
VGVGAAVVSAVCKVKALLEKERVGATTVKLNWLEPEPEALVAVIVTVKVPVWVAVPLITPLFVSTLIPAGSPLAA